MTLNLAQRYKKTSGIQNKLVYFLFPSGNILEKSFVFTPKASHRGGETKKQFPLGNRFYCVRYDK
jgi:hypothetical protein